MIKDDKSKLIPTRVQSGWRVCINHRKLNATTRKFHFSLPFHGPDVREVSWTLILLFSWWLLRLYPDLSWLDTCISNSFYFENRRERYKQTIFCHLLSKNGTRGYLSDHWYWCTPARLTKRPQLQPHGQIEGCEPWYVMLEGPLI